MAKQRPLILDSWAILSYLAGEPAGEAVANLIADAADRGRPMMMTVANAGEVWYIVARRIDAAEADETIGLLRELGIQFVDIDWPITKRAAEFKTRGNISYADCYAAALASVKEGHLITGDREFEQLADEISIDWLK